MSALVTIQPAPVTAYRQSTNAAETCKAIVVATATNIQGRKYVCVEGWQAIAVAHDCAASARAVEKVEGGVRAIGEIRRMSDGVVIAEAEGFVGEDEPTWFGGQSRGKTLPKRSDYAIRAMAQTRAISRAARSAFAHVVVMMNAGLQTTPAEEVPAGGFDDHSREEGAWTGPRKVREAAVEAMEPRPAQSRPVIVYDAREAPAAPEGGWPCRTKGDLKAALKSMYDELASEAEPAAHVDTVLRHRMHLRQVQAVLPNYWHGEDGGGGFKHLLTEFNIEVNDMGEMLTDDEPQSILAAG